MVLRNPTEQTVSIQIDGVVYSVAPQGVTKNLSDSVAKVWLATHGFLVASADVEVTKEPTKQEVKVETKKEEVVEEVKKEEVVETKKPEVAPVKTVVPEVKK